MTERDLILLAVGAVAGYCFCFVVEIARLLREHDEEERTPPRIPQRERDPADWWKEES